jgi:hypothetical protein
VKNSASGTIDRRDAAVAAALAGAVVVVLGYASGVGIRTSGEVVAMQQPPAVQPAAPQTGRTTTTPPILVAQSPILTAPVSTPRVVHEHPRPATPHDHTPAEPTPTPEPEPEPTPAPTACRPSLLDGLPVAGPLVEAASSLLFGVVAATPVTALTDPLACAVGKLVGPTCCPTEAAHTRGEAGP